MRSVIAIAKSQQIVVNPSSKKATVIDSGVRGGTGLIGLTGFPTENDDPVLSSEVLADALALDARLDNLELSTSWTTLSYAGNFTTFAGWPPLAYRKHKNMIWLRGLVRNIIDAPPTAGNPYLTIATLPEGYRPEKHLLFAILTTSNISQIRVRLDGLIQLVQPNENVPIDMQWIQMFGISFPSL